ncbi:MAG TPA: tRNA (adenosine(37)-N6)-threonylcarbamoyltransferase complex ATPase subunit type 1 TsaE [Aequorivita sp.]|nr:tRNA (adenosine(37)-N6)-threonylcarbamoyltransferase complex ATPase subunit type 1 TsaE [Aequorivita sp.]
MEFSFDLKDIPTIAAKILSAANSKILLFYGPMGVGKTTIIKELAKQLGADEEASSPSFSIVNEYKIPDDLIYHFDFYRLKSPMEAYDLGVEEYFYSGHYVFIEWPEKIQNLLPENSIRIDLIINKNQSRTIKIMPMI